MKAPLQIAIDGPVAAGKGDIAQRLAKRLGFLYIYTGSMYRALALACLKAGVPLKDEQKVVDLLRKTDIELVPQQSQEYSYTVLLNSVDVTDQLFTPEVAQGSSDVSTIAHVRQLMVTKQQEMARGKSVVMEGRDIGLRVLPHAQFKIFLTARAEVRARRRHTQMLKKDLVKSYEEVLEDTRKRDLQDSKRTTDPLQKLPEAWELDTTHLTQEAVVEKIMQELKRSQLV